MKKLILPLLLLILALSAEARRFMIVGYVSEDAPIQDEKVLATKFTHLHYMYASVEEGVVQIKNEALLSKVVSLKAINKKLKIVLAVGGSKGSVGFVKAVATAESRERLASSMIEALKKYKLDGIELHWVFKAGGRFENSFNRTDQHNYALLMELLRAKVDQQSLTDKRLKRDAYLLSMAGSAGRQYLVYSELNKAHTYLDYITLQAYGYTCTVVNGGGVVKGMAMTSHYSNLYASRADNTFKFCVDANVNEYTNFGIPSRKIVMGVSLYSKSWNGVLEDEHGLFQVSDSVREELSQREALKQYSAAKGYVSYWDQHAQAAYQFNDSTKVFVSLENRKSIRKKASYTRRKKLGGMACLDYGKDESHQLVKKVNRGLRGPAITCSTKKSYEPRNPMINKRVLKKRTKQYNES